MSSTTNSYAPDNAGAERKPELVEFIRSLEILLPQEAGAALVTRLIAEESLGQTHFDSVVAQAAHLVESLPLPLAWQRVLRAELVLAREYEVPKPVIPSVPVATPLLAALTSGELHQLFNSLMEVPTGLIPLLAEQALREHKTKAADEWESIRFLDMLLHMNERGTRNMDNQCVLREWIAGARIREAQQAQQQLLPEQKQVVTEADRPRLEQRLQQLSEHWEAQTNPKVQTVIRLFEQRLAELDTIKPKTIVDESKIEVADLFEKHNIEITARRIVLFVIFNRRPRIRLDARTHELGQKCGYKSGRNIYDYYVKYSKPDAIIEADGAELSSLITDIELVLPLVVTQYQQDTRNKLKQLKSR